MLTPAAGRAESPSLRDFKSWGSNQAAREDVMTEEADRLLGPSPAEVAAYLAAGEEALSRYVHDLVENPRRDADRIAEFVLASCHIVK